MTRKIIAKSLEEESVEYYTEEGAFLGSANHDDHGWSGMESVSFIITNICEQFGIELIHVEE
jgi:hypothetical protein